VKVFSLCLSSDEVINYPNDSSDSGGPLVLSGTPILVGIVSYGSRICAVSMPDVYTRSSEYVGEFHYAKLIDRPSLTFFPSFLSDRMDRAELISLSTHTEHLSILCLPMKSQNNRQR
jgi:Trypsin